MALLGPLNEKQREQLEFSFMQPSEEELEYQRKQERKRMFRSGLFNAGLISGIFAVFYGLYTLGNTAKSELPEEKQKPAIVQEAPKKKVDFSSLVLKEEKSSKKVESLEKKLEKKVKKKFSELSDPQKRTTLKRIAKKMKGGRGYTLPVGADNNQKKEALSLGKAMTFCGFGTDREGGTSKHNGSDIYGYGNEVGPLTEGVIVEVGRNIKGMDRGNLIVIDHGDFEGYKVISQYLHVGGISPDLKKGKRVVKFDDLATVDCTGISNKKRRLYNPGSKICRSKAHLHFQIKVGDRYVNPVFFFPEFSTEAQRSNLSGRYLSIKPRYNLEDYVHSFINFERYGSFKKSFVDPTPDPSKRVFKKVAKKKDPVHKPYTAPKKEGYDVEAKAKELYGLGKKGFYSEKPQEMCVGVGKFSEVVDLGNNSFVQKAQQSIGTIKRKLDALDLECDLGKQ